MEEVGCCLTLSDGTKDRTSGADGVLGSLQVKVLELEKTLENERMRLGELRKRHYALAGVIDQPVEEELSRPVASPRRGILKKPPLAQKPTLVPKQDCQVPSLKTWLSG